MKRPKTHQPKRPRMASSAVARSHKDAAIKLVRLEFDAARLQMGIDQAQNRADVYQNELNRNHEQRRMMMDILND